MHFRWTSDVIEVVFGSLGKTSERVSSSSDAVSDLSYPPMDAVIADGELHIWVDVPGVRHEDMSVYLRGDLLVIEGMKRSHYPHTLRRKFLRMERQSVPFRRIFRIVKPVSYDEITSELHDGVLHIKWGI